MPLSGLCAASGKFTALRSPGKDRSRELNNNMLREKHYLQNPVSWNRLGFIYFIARTVRIITMWFKCLGHQFIYMEKLQIKLFVPSVKKIYRYIIEKKKKSSWSILSSKHVSSSYLWRIFSYNYAISILFHGTTCKTTKPDPNFLVREDR